MRWCCGDGGDNPGHRGRGIGGGRAEAAAAQAEAEACGAGSGGARRRQGMLDEGVAMVQMPREARWRFNRDPGEAVRWLSGDEQPWV